MKNVKDATWDAILRATEDVTQYATTSYDIWEATRVPRRYGEEYETRYALTWSLNMLEENL